MSCERDLVRRHCACPCPIADGLHFKAFPGTSFPIGPGGQLQCLSMKCPGCGTEMTAMTLDGHLDTKVAIDVCATCQAFWFDHLESLQLCAASTLKLMKFIGEHSSPRKPSLPDPLHCPRCFFFSSRRRHTRLVSDWSSDVCSSD